MDLIPRDKARRDFAAHCSLPCLMKMVMGNYRQVESNLVFRFAGIRSHYDNMIMINVTIFRLEDVEGTNLTINVPFDDLFNSKKYEKLG